MAGPHAGLVAGLVGALLAGLVAGCAAPASGQSPAPDRALIVRAPNGAREEIPFTIGKPEGAGPFPAVVIMHDCSGLGPRSSGAPGRWARELGSRGYVTVIPDSFTTRGHPDGVCTDASPTRGEVAPSRRVRDAYAALAHARALPYVDGRRAFLMGGSHGGSTTLASMAAPESTVEPLAREKGTGFAAAVALYPSCGATLGDRAGTYRPVAPILILIGEKDDWTPAEACVKLAASTRASEYPVAITVYPDAHHSFDSDRPVRFVAARVNRNAPGGRGATTGGNATAWADSIRRVDEFFGERLTP